MQKKRPSNRPVKRKMAPAWCASELLNCSLSTNGIVEVRLDCTDHTSYVAALYNPNWSSAVCLWLKLVKYYIGSCSSQCDRGSLTVIHTVGCGNASSVTNIIFLVTETKGFLLCMIRSPTSVIRNF